MSPCHEIRAQAGPEGLLQLTRYPYGSRGPAVADEALELYGYQKPEGVLPSIDWLVRLQCIYRTDARMIELAS